ncbi:MAG: hypothetical protein KBF73_01445 [Flavobacteriales bacterium]|nr:hypothetical protein [Flavobacteriales bacterium]
MNEVVSVILEILKYTVPSGIVFATAYFLLKKFMEEQRQIALIQANASIKAAAVPSSGMIPTRLQAYERLILFLERIEPNQMIPRVHRPAMTSSIFKRELQRTIREEFEHNLTQQIYVSSEAWNKLIDSRNATNQLIELAGKKVGDNATGVQFSSALFEILAAAGISPTTDAIETLKAEARQLIQ